MDWQIIIDGVSVALIVGAIGAIARWAWNALKDHLHPLETVNKWTLSNVMAHVLYLVVALTAEPPVGDGTETNESNIAVQYVRDLASHKSAKMAKEQVTKATIRDVLNAWEKQHLITLYNVRETWTVAPTTEGHQLVDEWAAYCTRRERIRWMLYGCLFIMPIGMFAWYANTVGLLPAAIRSNGATVIGVLLGPGVAVIICLLFIWGIFDHLRGTKSQATETSKRYLSSPLSTRQVLKVPAVIVLVDCMLLFALVVGFNQVNLIQQIAQSSPYQSNVSPKTAETFCTGTLSLCQFPVHFIEGSVQMVCYQDNQWITGVSRRWIYIQAPDGSEGFVFPSTVSNQKTTPDCTYLPWFNATEWALTTDGQTAIPDAAKNGKTVTYWSSWSWLFVYDAWELGAGTTPAYDAATAAMVWSLYQKNGKSYAPTEMPPRGSLVFFSHGSAGYVAISLGDGWIEGTQGDVEAQMKPVTHTQISQLAEEGMPELGYVSVTSI